MKIKKQKLLDALNYLVSINALPGRERRERPLSDLDFSEFSDRISREEVGMWRLSGLSNIDFMKAKFLTFNEETGCWQEK